MRLLPLLFCFAGSVCAVARPGLLQTLDGRTFNGDVALTNGVFTVNATNSVPLTNVLSLAFDMPATGTPRPRGPGNGLLGHYFTNTNLSGDAFVRLDETIAFDWGDAEPAPELPKTNFSVLWCGEVEVPATGDYQFSLVADDGGRLLLNGKMLIDSWQRTGSTELEAPPVGLQTGVRYPIQLQYFHTTGPSRARLSWSGPDIPRSTVPKDRLHAKACLNDHTVTIATNAPGLLATYHAKSDFTGPTWTRIDPAIDFDWSTIDPVPGIARTNFSVRWSGQLLPEHTETYTFHLLADEPARLWIDGKLLLATGGDNFFFERRESVPLNGGERVDFRMETQSTGGSATAKLSWSSLSTPKAIVPATNLFPSRPTPVRNAALLPDRTPPGVLLRNGTFLAGTVERATESSLRLNGRDTPLSTVNIARIILQPLAQRMRERIVPGRAGVLLAKGDFVDADFTGIDNGQLRTSSILFGPRSFEVSKEVLAVVLRNTAPAPAAYEIRLHDQTLLNATAVTAERDTLIVRDTMAGTVKVPFADLALLKRSR